ncbi:Endoribonuclease YbeY [Galdieria sulphuraria]|nr:Endoribonuclease YbeY [Galdieria sulphuraria]
MKSLLSWGRTNFCYLFPVLQKPNFSPILLKLHIVDVSVTEDEILKKKYCFRNNYISSLNSKWRNKKEPTDVLSFAQEEQTLLGDIVISVETAYKQALERNYSLRDEIRVLLVHGFLHLLGYDHEESEQRRDEMEELENKLLSSLQWKGKGLVALS